MVNTFILLYNKTHY